MKKEPAQAPAQAQAPAPAPAPGNNDLKSDQEESIAQAKEVIPIIKFNYT